MPRLRSLASIDLSVGANGGCLHVIAPANHRLTQIEEFHCQPLYQLLGNSKNNISLHSGKQNLFTICVRQQNFMTFRGFVGGGSKDDGMRVCCVPFY